MNVEIKKGVLGQYSLAYSCSRCSAQLKSKLSEAGSTDICPECNFTFTVPGADLVQKHNDDIQKKLKQREDAASARDAAKRSAELYREERLSRLTAKAKDMYSASESQAMHQSTEAVHRSSNASSTASVSGNKSSIEPEDRNCPYCGESIKLLAVKCRYCGEFLTKELRQRQQASSQVQVKASGDGCSQVLIIAFGIVVGVVLLMLL